MKYKIFYIPVLILISLSGCIDNPVQQDNYIIKGEVYGGYKPLISINNGPIIKCDWSGNFEAESQAMPYSLLITDIDSYLFDWLTVKYTGITINTPSLVYSANISGYTYVQHDLSYELCNLSVTFPELTERKFLVTKFISEDVFYQTGAHRNGFPGTYFINSEVYIPKTNSYITGKIYYMEYDIDTLPGSIVHYDKFGIKEITLAKGANNEIIFENSDLYDPIDYEMNISINLPPGFSSLNSVIYMSNSSLNPGSDLELGFMTQNGSYIIPLLPVNDFKIKTINVYCNDLFLFSNGVMKCVTSPGEPVNINYSETVNLITPPDGSENITKFTALEIQDNDGPAIYEFCLLYGAVYFQLFTDKHRVQLADFESWNFELPKNTVFKWTVRKFRNYNSIDEFVTKAYIFENRSDYIEVNKGRTFKTAP